MAEGKTLNKTYHLRVEAIFARSLRMSHRPLIDTSVKERHFVYPIGLVVWEPPLLGQSLLPGNSLGYHVTPPSGQQRARGLSNATMATADIRLTMTRSITDLFSCIGEVHSVQVQFDLNPYHSKFMLTTSL